MADDAVDPAHEGLLTTRSISGLGISLEAVLHRHLGIQIREQVLPPLLPHGSKGATPPPRGATRSTRPSSERLHG